MCIYLYMYICICVCIRICMFICICICMCICICICMCAIFLPINLSIYLSIDPQTSLPLSLSLTAPYISHHWTQLYINSPWLPGRLLSKGVQTPRVHLVVAPIQGETPELLQKSLPLSFLREIKWGFPQSWGYTLIASS